MKRGQARRWSSYLFGVILGIAAVCHGCHAGDHDDELSANGRARPATVQSPDRQGAGLTKTAP